MSVGRPHLSADPLSGVPPAPHSLAGPRSPRVVAFGDVRCPGRRRTAGLEWLRLAPESSRALAETPADVILIDGSLPQKRLAEILGAVASLPVDGRGRPAVLLVAPPGRRRPIPEPLAGMVDEVI